MSSNMPALIEIAKDSFRALLSTFNQDSDAAMKAPTHIGLLFMSVGVEQDGPPVIRACLFTYGAVGVPDGDSRTVTGAAALSREAAMEKLFYRLNALEVKTRRTGGDDYVDVFVRGTGEFEM